MSDFIDNYKRRVQKYLSRHEPGPVLRMVEALCLPSFHPETLLRMALGPTGSTFRLVTVTSNMWYAGTGDKGKRPARFQEVVEVPLPNAERFWKSVDGLDALSIQSDSAFGRDGMSVLGCFAEAEKSVSFETWCPTPASRTGEFVHLIYDLAWEVLIQKTSIERLEQLHGYLRLDLPYRWIEGGVMCLRFFGGLVSEHESDLRRLLALAPPGEPLVIDMTNFEGMGTLLYPIFIEFASRQPLLMWAVSAAARRHLQAMGLAEERVFETVEAAVSSLKYQ